MTEPKVNHDAAAHERGAGAADEPGRSSFRRWLTRPQTMIALSAVVLSICGLFVSIYEASLIRQHQRASVWPHVAVTPSINQGSVRLFVQNAGVGPARIEAAAVLVDGEVKEDWEDVFLTIMEGPTRVSAYQSLINGQVLPANSREERILEISAETAEMNAEPTRVLSRKILEGAVDVQVCYCSVYDECWMSRMQDFLDRSRAGQPARGRLVDHCSAMPTSGI